jgi:hypothetical protein
MQIQYINTRPATQDTFTDQPISLSARMSSAMGVNALEDGPTIQPIVDDGPITIQPIDTPFYLDRMTEVFIEQMALKEGDPNKVLKALIDEMKTLKDDNGTPIFKSYNTMMTLLTAIRENVSAEESPGKDECLTKMYGITFGLALFTDSIARDIFFPPDDGRPTRELFKDE